MRWKTWWTWWPRWPHTAWPSWSRPASPPAPPSCCRASLSRSPLGKVGPPGSSSVLSLTFPFGRAEVRAAAWCEEDVGGAGRGQGVMSYHHPTPLQKTLAMAKEKTQMLCWSGEVLGRGKQPQLLHPHHPSQSDLMAHSSIPGITGWLRGSWPAALSSFPAKGPEHSHRMFFEFHQWWNGWLVT